MRSGVSKKEIPSDSARIREMRMYLGEYSVFRKLLESADTAPGSFGNPRECKYNSKKTEDIERDTLLRSKMFEVRRFVLSLPAGDEKVFLFLRYIHGESMEACAEKMELSVRTVYRLHKRALLFASGFIEEYRIQCENIKCYG